MRSKWRLSGDLIEAFKCIKGINKVNYKWLFRMSLVTEREGINGNRLRRISVQILGWHRPCHIPGHITWHPHSSQAEGWTRAVQVCCNMGQCDFPLGLQLVHRPPTIYCSIPPTIFPMRKPNWRLFFGMAMEDIWPPSYSMHASFPGNGGCM